jgi:hypothetical protein
MEKLESDLQKSSFPNLTQAERFPQANELAESHALHAKVQSLPHFLLLNRIWDIYT